jgi:hypothetical protein
MDSSSLRRLEKKRESLEEKLRPLRMEIPPFRLVHAEKIREALKPTIEAAARTVFVALAEFTEALATLNSCEEEVERAGGQPSYVHAPRELGAIEFRVRRLAGLKDGQ